MPKPPQLAINHKVSIPDSEHIRVVVVLARREAAKQEIKWLNKPFLTRSWPLFTAIRDILTWGWLARDACFPVIRVLVNASSAGPRCG